MNVPAEVWLAIVALPTAPQMGIVPPLSTSLLHLLYSCTSSQSCTHHKQNMSSLMIQVRKWVIGAPGIIHVAGRFCAEVAECCSHVHCKGCGLQPTQARVGAVLQDFTSCANGVIYVPQVCHSTCCHGGLYPGKWLVPPAVSAPGVTQRY